MKYIIAFNKTILREGWKPASSKVVDGYSILNENELRYRYQDKPLEESAALVDGIIVSRQTAVDFLNGNTTLKQIKEHQPL